MHLERKERPTHERRCLKRQRSVRKSKTSKIFRNGEDYAVRKQKRRARCFYGGIAGDILACCRVRPTVIRQGYKAFGEEGRRQVVCEMVGLAVAIFVLLAINTAYAVYWSFLVRRFATALQEKKEEAFYSVLYEVAINLVLKVPLSSLTEYWKGQLSLKLRSICTKGLFFAFFNSKHKPFFHTNIENAGIRILEVESWIRDVQHLAIVIVSRIMNLFAFSSLMLYLSSRLFVALTLYAFLGTFILLHYFYEKITTLSMSTTQKMTSVQYQVVRIYENRESIAFYNGAARECRILWNFFDAFVKAAYERMVWAIGMHSFTEVLEDVTVVFPYLVIAPLYFGERSSMAW